MGAVIALNGFEMPANMFDDFWVLFPRKEGKKDAQKAWSCIDPADHVDILVGAAAWRAEWRLRGVETAYIPLPATWLRAERWTDEIPKSAGHSSHLPATPQTLPERGEIPEHVKALLAKLRR